MVGKSVTYVLRVFSAFALAVGLGTPMTATAQTALRLPAFPVSMSLTPTAVQGDQIAKNITKPRSGKIDSWNTLVNEIQPAIASGALDDRTQAVALLETVNRFWNRRVFFVADERHYSLSDVWTTPLETLSEGSGDCEDFAIGKYFTLLRAGVPESQLALGLAFYTPTGEAHITLSVTLGNGEVLVLDNLVGDVRSASQRSDLVPVLAMNRQALTIYKLDYIQAGNDLAGRFAAMNARYEQQSRDWMPAQAVATLASGLNHAVTGSAATSTTVQ